MEKTSMEELRKKYKIAVFVGIAMVASLFCYAVIVELIKSDYEPFEGFSPIEGIEILRYALIGFVAVEFLVIRFYRNSFFAGNIGMAVLERGGSSRPGGALLMMSIIIYAFCESVAIYGLVLFFLNGGSMDFYSFAVLSLVYFAVFFPKYSQWEEWVKKIERP